MLRYHGTVFVHSSSEKARFRFDQRDRSTTWSPQCHHLAFHERWAYDKGRRLALVMQRHTLVSRCWTLEFGCSSLASRLSASGMSADASCAASGSSSLLLFAPSSKYRPPCCLADPCQRLGVAYEAALDADDVILFHSSLQSNGVCADDVGLSSRLRHHVGCGT